ncbi:MAG: glucose-6-phosphate dehydrogenase [Candidatus Magasanikbacteria bacterium]|nr:glucose-6-phosphate dehydrogenase [Candidatus Magasanikbacteria bacterium]
MTPITIKQPFIITIFGASGDLAKLMLFPALYSLYEQGRLPVDFYIIGFARTKKTDSAFQQDFIASVKAAAGGVVNESALKKLSERVRYFTGEYGRSADFESYAKFLKSLKLPANSLHLAYFSVPSVAYKPIIENLAALSKSGLYHIRLILEKPFGVDKQSAEDIFHFALQHFEEEKFYLLDHYLGKPAVRSIMHLRESNRILSHMMRGYEIANVQITAFEEFGVKERASYFDQVGTIKDFVQSHLMQILALATMSLPIDKNAQSLQREKYGVLAAIECPHDPKNIVIGQYQGYTKENGVPQDSHTETFAALRLFIDRLDWFGVPIYVRTGKRLAKKQTYVVVELKKFPFQAANEPPNRLIFELYPFEQAHLTLLNKQEDPAALQEIIASHSVACNVKAKCLPPGHAPLLLDVLRGEKKYFLSFPEIIASWDVVDKISALIADNKIKLELYQAGSSGPAAHLRLPARDGFNWYSLPS